MKPKFSFVVSSYNYGRYLSSCLESIVGQDYEPDDFEVICVDDGSTDRSVEIIKEFAKRYKSIRLFQMNRAGIEKVCNEGIRAARFPYIIRVDADDFIATNLLKIISAAILKDPQYAFYYPKEYVLYFSELEQTECVLPEFDRNEILSRGDFLATGTAYLRSSLVKINLYPEDIKNCGLENYAVVLKLLANRQSGFAVSGTKVYYRRHHKNVSIVGLESIIQFGNKLLAQYDLPYRTNEFHPYRLKLPATSIAKQCS